MMDHKNRSEFVMYLLKGHSRSTFAQLEPHYQKKYASSPAVAFRSLWTVLRRLERKKKITVSGQRDKRSVITVVNEPPLSFEPLPPAPSITLRNEKLKRIQMIAQFGK